MSQVDQGLAVKKLLLNLNIFQAFHVQKLSQSLNEICIEHFFFISFDHSVHRYHEWMSNLELQELTASEPLTIAEEYAMQSSWRTDDDSKYIFFLNSFRN